MDTTRSLPGGWRSRRMVQLFAWCILLLACLSGLPNVAPHGGTRGQSPVAPNKPPRGPAAPQHGCASNLFSNADFELGAASSPFAFAGGTAVIMDNGSNGPSNWTKATNTTLGNNYWVSNTQANSGSHFLYTYSSGYTEASNDACNQQTFATASLCPNTTYTICVFAADARADGKPSGLAIEVQELRSTGANSRPLQFQRFTLPDNPAWSDGAESVIPWTQYCYTFTTHPNTDRAIIWLSASSLDSGATTSYVVIDDVCMPGVSPCGAATPKVDLNISKSVSPTTYAPGLTTNVTYTVQVTNYGPSNVSAAPVVDNAPANVTFNSWTCSITGVGTGTGTNACGAASGSGNVNTNVSLKLNAVATFTINATIGAAATGTITNTVNEQLPASGVGQDPAINRSDSANAASTPSSPLAVRLTGFNAQTPGNTNQARTATGTTTPTGATLRWSTGFEAANLGFNVYREEGGQRIRLNAAVIAGSALLAGTLTPLTAGNSYAWYDARGTNGTAYWLEALDLDGSSAWHGPIYAQTGNESSAPVQRALTLNELNMPNANAAQIEFAQTPGVSQTSLLKTTAAPDWTLPNENAVKLLVRKTGWYRVTAAELASVGFSNKVNALFLQLFTDGNEVPIKIIGQGNTFDAIEFYGQGLDTTATDTRVYWLTAGQASTQRINTQPALTAASFSASSFFSTVERKDRQIYFSGLLNGDAGNWFGSIISNSGTTLQLTTRAVQRRFAQPVLLEITLQGVTDQRHLVNVTVNGQAVGTINFLGKDRRVEMLSFALSLLRDGDNDIRLTTQNGANDLCLADTVRLTYPRGFVADNDALQFSLLAGQTAFVGGFSTPNIRLLELSASGARELTVKSQGFPGDYGFALQSAVNATYVALTDARLERVAGLKLNQPSNWRATYNTADFVIVTHRDFWTAANRLAGVRRLNSMFVAVVDVEDIYDEFSYGAKSPQAIKDLLSYARTNWARKPGFALLLGEGTHDPRNYLGKSSDTGNNDFVPTHLGTTKYFETALDNWFADTNNDGVPELALGRLPVRTAAQADAVVGKILAFKLPATPRSSLFVSDRTTEGENFKALSEQLARTLPALMPKQFINRNDGAPDKLRSQIVSTVNLTAPLVVNWLGHGSTQVWTGDGLLRAEDAAALTNPTASLFVMTSCLNGFFTDPQQQSLGEAVLTTAPGGAFAVIASSGLNQPAPQNVFNLTLYQGLFSQGLTLGEAMTAARAAAADADVRNTYVLFGDPTMRVSTRR